MMMTMLAHVTASPHLHPYEVAVLLAAAAILLVQAIRAAARR